MREVNIAGVDLNLLTALEALLRERSVTRAADSVGLSQPAMSRALARLRELFDDRLFVRTPAGLVPTPRAEAAAEPLARALSGVRSVLQAPGFDPSSHRGDFRILCPDGQSLELLPGLVDRLRRQAPGIDLIVLPNRGDPLDMIEAGEAELAAGRFMSTRAGIFGTNVYRTRFACVVRANHPVVATGLTLERFVELPHMLVTITGQGSGPVDIALAEMGLSRHVAVRLPHFLVAPLVVARTDMVLTLPRGLALRMARLASLAVLPPPLQLPEFDIGLAWHERFQDDPAHAWLRREAASALREGAEG